MAINKVNYGGQTLIDTSEDTAEAGDVLAGQTFHSKSGLQSTGTLVLPEMVVLSYGHSTWSDFIDAYADNRVVYCRASSGSNPGSGSQTRMAFMAYVNNADTPTEVEFQYYRSVSSHTSSQQGDQVFVYKLNKTNGWSVTTREASVKININANNEGIKTTYSNGVVTTGHSNSVTAKTTQAVYPIAYDAQGHITSSGSAVSVPTQPSDIGAQPVLESGTNIKTINNESLLGSGDLEIEGVPHVELTQAEYDALTPAQKENGDVYFITDSDDTAYSGIIGSGELATDAKTLVGAVNELASQFTTIRNVVTNVSVPQIASRSFTYVSISRPTVYAGEEIIGWSFIVHDPAHQATMGTGDVLCVANMYSGTSGANTVEVHWVIKKVGL